MPTFAIIDIKGAISDLYHPVWDVNLRKALKESEIRDIVLFVSLGANEMRNEVRHPNSPATIENIIKMLEKEGFTVNAVVTPTDIDTQKPGKHYSDYASGLAEAGDKEERTNRVGDMYELVIEKRKDLAINPRDLPSSFVVIEANAESAELIEQVQRKQNGAPPLTVMMIPEKSTQQAYVDQIEQHNKNMYFVMDQFVKYSQIVEDIKNKFPTMKKESDFRSAAATCDGLLVTIAEPAFIKSFPMDIRNDLNKLQSKLTEVKLRAESMIGKYDTDTQKRIKERVRWELAHVAAHPQLGADFKLSLMLRKLSKYVKTSHLYDQRFKNDSKKLAAMRAQELGELNEVIKNVIDLNPLGEKGLTSKDCEQLNKFILEGFDNPTPAFIKKVKAHYNIGEKAVEKPLAEVNKMKVPPAQIVKEQPREPTITVVKSLPIENQSRKRAAPVHGAPSSAGSARKLPPIPGAAVRASSAPSVAAKPKEKLPEMGAPPPPPPPPRENAKIKAPRVEKAEADKPNKPAVSKEPRVGLAYADELVKKVAAREAKSEERLQKAEVAKQKAEQIRLEQEAEAKARKQKEIAEKFSKIQVIGPAKRIKNEPASAASRVESKIYDEEWDDADLSKDIKELAGVIATQVKFANEKLTAINNNKGGIGDVEKIKKQEDELTKNINELNKLNEAANKEMKKITGKTEVSELREIKGDISELHKTASDLFKAITRIGGYIDVLTEEEKQRLAKKALAEAPKEQLVAAPVNMESALKGGLFAYKAKMQGGAGNFADTVNLMKENKTNPYAVLEVKENASNDDIQSAYDKKLFDAEGKDADLVLIKAAYSLIKDDFTRAMYAEEMAKLGYSSKK